MKASLIDGLIAWYYQHRRDLPWHKDRDPYKIWLSEIMLQQTQVDTVIPYFHRFVEAFPTVRDLAMADPQVVLKLWEGLGYYSRAKRLIPCAQRVVEDFGGAFPKTKKEMLTLPGVGSYTAGAVLGIAYNVKAPAVDGNVLRVMARFLAWDLDIGDPKHRLAFESYLSDHLPDDMHGFNQALMELGATLCTPKNPQCASCPIHADCQALAQDRVNQLPIKQKKKPSPVYWAAVARIESEGRWLVYHKEDGGLLSGFWSLPYGLGDTQALALEALNDWLTDHLGTWWLRDTLSLEAACTKLPPHRPLVKHVFTHQIWQMQPYCATIEANTARHLQVEFPRIKWASQEDLGDLAISTAMRKVIAVLAGQNK